MHNLSPTTQLREEHEIILGVLDDLDDLVLDLDHDGAELALRAKQLAAFILQYVDEFHHEKEEQLLFPAMKASGMPYEGGPIPVMLHEHELGRQLVRTLVSTSSAGLPNVTAFQEAATRFSELMRNHIRKENDALFMMADRVLSPQVKRDLVELFKARGTGPALPE